MDRLRPRPTFSQGHSVLIPVICKKNWYCFDCLPYDYCKHFTHIKQSNLYNWARDVLQLQFRDETKRGPRGKNLTKDQSPNKQQSLGLKLGILLTLEARTRPQ